MTAFCPHQDRLQGPAGDGRSPIASSSRQMKRLRALVRHAVDRAIDAFGSRADSSLEPAARGNRDRVSDTARFPQRPLMLGDKWDF
jgi:hypothetical protein